MPLDLLFLFFNPFHWLTECFIRSITHTTANNLLTGTIPNEIGHLALSHNLTVVFVADNVGLKMNVSIPGLRDVVFTGCSTQGCQPRQFDTANANNTVIRTHCAGLLEDYYERYRQQVPVDICHMLKSNCLVCS